MSHITKQAT